MINVTFNGRFGKKRPRWTYNLKELLADFNESAETSLLIANAKYHYKTMTCGQTSLRNAIHKYGYNMSVHIEGRHLLLNKE